MSRLVTVYTKPAGCNQCDNTKRLLTSSGIPYQEIIVNPSDVQSIDELKLIAKEKGIAGTMPYVLVIDLETKEQHDWFGFQPDKIKNLKKEQTA